MKTDTILTMDEYFADRCIATKHVNPPANNARHIPITSEGVTAPRREEHGCRCDRWGHPCLECDEHKVQAKTELPISVPAKQTG